MDRPEAEGDLRVRRKVVGTKGAEAPFYALWIGSKVAGIGQEQTDKTCTTRANRINQRLEIK